MEVKAVLRGARVSAQKCRLVADLIRGKSVSQAINLLTHLPKKAADILLKLLKSAVSNAEYNEGFDVDRLFVCSLYVDKAKSLRRMHARAKGRGCRIEKQSCHVFLAVGYK